MSQHFKDLADFLDHSPSPFHAVTSAARRLQDAGFTSLEESSIWNLEPGKGYYTTRNQSSIIAFRMPRGELSGWRMAASHSDSPTYRVKADAWAGSNPCGMVRLPVEGYGGMIAASWMDRPLTVAGRALVRTETGIESRLVFLDRDLLTIPSLAIHMERSINSGRELNPQRDMQPLYGLEGGPSLTELVAQQLGVAAEDVVDTDLTLCPRQNTVLLGGANELIQGPRLDDLECAWGTLGGFLAAAPANGMVNVWCMFDNEEVGSGTRQGAQGTFLPDVMARVESVCGVTAQQHHAALANSLLLSADNAHAQHPNWTDKADPNALVALNGGVVLKYNASQKYTTTGLTGALFTQICKQAQVPVQRFTNRADMPGGSTLGNLLSAQVSIPMMDVGLPQLAMHACIETAGAKDPEYLLTACTAFYSAAVTCTADGAYTLG